MIYLRMVLCEVQLCMYKMYMSPQIMEGDLLSIHYLKAYSKIKWTVASMALAVHSWCCPLWHRKCSNRDVWQACKRCDTYFKNIIWIINLDEYLDKFVLIWINLEKSGERTIYEAKKLQYDFSRLTPNMRA